jgi:hypothetical protein
VNEIVRRDSIEEICGHRNRALQLYRQGAELLDEAAAAHARAVKWKGGYAQTPHLRAESNGYRQNTEEFVASMTRKVDQDLWRALINGTSLGSIMDREEREKFEKGLEADPAPATPENVQATMERLLGESQMIFKRGLVNAFKRLCRDYRSNDGFKIGERTVITYGVTYDKGCNWFRFNQHSEETVKDVDRVMHVLDGKKAPEYQQGICAAIRTAMTDYRKGGSTEVETEYWRAKFFKNGNIHLWCRRDDLRLRANRIIAEHYGEVIPAGPTVAEHSTGYVAPAPEFKADDQDFFATPKAVVDRMLEVAEIQAGDWVLEPSAGEGAIAHQILPPNQVTADVTLVCLEINHERLAKLQATSHKSATCLRANFLSLTPAAKLEYDKILMNPPFSKGQDIHHVAHAYRFLKPGGRVVAVMGAGAVSRSDKLGEKFGKLLEMVGSVEELPAGSFKESGTMVRAVLVTLEKPL